jgi:D-alanine transaminase
MNQTGLVLLNETLVSRNEALVDIEDRGYQFGDGIYEVIRVYDGHIFLMAEHLERLKRSASEIDLILPVSLAQLEEKLIDLVKQTACKNGMIYIQLSRGVAPRNHNFPSPEVKAQLVAYTKPLDRPLNQQKEGVKAILVNDIRWLRCDIKTINLLPNVLAKQEAVKNQAYEAIQHRDGIVTEGSASNVFIVKENKLYTHPANNFILNGITRQFVLKLCAELDISVIEQTFDVNDLLQADEVFMTSTTSEIIPIVQVDTHLIGQGKPGALTQQLQNAFEQRINQVHPQNPGR